jgi:proline-specific peptidase
MRSLAFTSLFLMMSFVLLLCQESATGSNSPTIFKIQQGFVDANGVMIYYEEFGEGKPLMIVHGAPGASQDYFLPYLIPLARHNRLVFIAERGSGKSQRLEDVSQYTVDNMIEDVEAVRKALGLGKMILLGHSYGGVLAQAYAFKYRENLSHLILCSTFPSTSQMNEVFVKIKENMSPALRERIDKMEKEGLFGHGLPYERNSYTDAYKIAKVPKGLNFLKPMHIKTAQGF